MPLSHRRFGLPVVAPALPSWHGAGATSSLTQGRQNCTWCNADRHRKMMVRTSESTRTKPDVTFEQYKKVKGNARMVAVAKSIIQKAVDAF